ncbi:BolA family protein [Gallaecimonas pentaromativorans]|uniref:Acid stress-induced BolA-like protein IbaG/YrbA n=1 Tax=Gallaecimonas pentaromativorans TaxID=584787 RepID=A0A3N1PVL2_9GAMM|nr:BolA family protein [Gallaecimonas pentaromativorans]MED5523607.1 BolA family protein [Pseudomonadota bacterium]ROQ30797.1 acid stress-induced BolA-like protein IbaG/YrbA [Gallaecimonas pentaromativorans]
MTNQEIEQLLRDSLSLDEVIVKSEGSHFNIIAVGSCFEGLRPVKRQQLVYGPLTEAIASNVVHAVSIKTYTPADWARDKKLLMLGQ